MNDIDEERWPLTVAFLRWDLEVMCSRPDAVMLLAYNNEQLCDRLIRAQAVVNAAKKQPRAPVGPYPELLKAIEDYDKAGPS